MISSAQPLALSAPRRPRWTSPRAPLSPSTMPLALSSLRPRPRAKAALLQRQSCHLRAACAKHPRRRALALPSPPQMPRSGCRPAAAVKLLLPLPPPWRFRCHHKAVSAKLPPPPRCRQAPTTKCHHHRRHAVAPLPLPPLLHCRCRQAAAAAAITTPSWHRSASAAAAAAKLPLLQPRCRHCRCAAATVAKLAIATAVKLPPQLHRRQPGAAPAPPPHHGQMKYGNTTPNVFCYCYFWIS